jgi:hypothetical protein
MWVRLGLTVATMKASINAEPSKRGCCYRALPNFALRRAQPRDLMLTRVGTLARLGPRYKAAGTGYMGPVEFRNQGRSAARSQAGKGRSTSQPERPG